MNIWSSLVLGLPFNLTAKHHCSIFVVSRKHNFIVETDIAKLPCYRFLFLSLMTYCDSGKHGCKQRTGRTFKEVWIKTELNSPFAKPGHNPEVWHWEKVTDVTKEMKISGSLSVQLEEEQQQCYDRGKPDKSPIARNTLQTRPHQG